MTRVSCNRCCVWVVLDDAENIIVSCNNVKRHTTTCKVHSHTLHNPLLCTCKDTSVPCTQQHTSVPCTTTAYKRTLHTTAHKCPLHTPLDPFSVLIAQNVPPITRFPSPLFLRLTLMMQLRILFLLRSSRK
jgi:hypothetical protein